MRRFLGSLKLLFVVCLAAVPMVARAATTDLRVLFDDDNDIATGCLVAGLPGVDKVLTTRVETTDNVATVAGSWWQSCQSGVLGGAVQLGGGWSAGLDAESGEMLVETRIPFSAFGGEVETMRIAIDAHQSSLQHVVLSNPGPTIVYFPQPAATRIRAANRHGSPRAIVLDGQRADWDGLTPKFDGIGADGVAGLRLINLFAYADTRESEQNLYFLFVLNVAADAPFAEDDEYSRPVGEGLIVPGANGLPTVLANDVNPSGNPMTAKLVDPPSAGELTLDQTGGFEYMPTDPSSTAPDSFRYMANNGKDSNVATVTINVGDPSDSDVNHEPTFTPGGDVGVLEDGPAQVIPNWATNISAGEGDGGQSVTFVITGNSNPALFADGPYIDPSGQLTYTPAPNAYGVASITVILVDDGGTANGGDDESAEYEFTISVEPINDAPSFNAGNDVTVGEDSGPYSAPWATSISPGPNEAGQSVSFTVTNDNGPLFSSQPTVSPSGFLSFTPAANVHGTAVVTVTIKDNGPGDPPNDNTGNTVQFTITVNSSNDAPTFTKGPDQVVNEDAGAQVVNPWATAISPGPADESGQSVTFNVVGNTNPSLFSVGPTISSTGVLSYTPAADANGTATITISLTDNGSPAATSATQSFTITVNAVNDEPSFVAGPDVTADSDAGPYSQSGWATGIDVGPANESTQTVTFEVVGNTAPGLFTVAPSISPDGTLTFTPVPGVTGVASITVQMRDSGGTANGGDDLTATVSFTITLDSAPTVTGTTPANGASGVTTNANVVVSFDENVDVTGAWFTIACSISGTHDTGNSVVTGGPTSFTINPNGDFAPGETCSTTIFAAQVTDQDSVDGPNTLTGNYTFSFSTDAQPSVVSTTPANGAAGVTTNAGVIVAFSEPVNVTGTWFQISCATSGMHNPGNSVVTGGPSTFSIDPTDFAQGEVCVGTIFAAQVSDQDANDPLDNMAADYNFTFTIDAQPSVVSTSPANGDFSQQPNTNVTVVFSEPVNVSGTWFTLNCSTSGSRTPSNTAVTTADNITFTIDPNVDFAVGETCTSVIFAAQISDQDGNDPPDALAADYNFTFGFDAPPSVSTTTPANGATDLPTNTDITINFSEAVTLSSGWLSITCGSTTITDADGTVTGGPTSYTFNPTSDLPEGLSCTATVLATLVTDNDTNDPPDAMTANYTFSFTTDAPPAVSSTTPANGATNQASNADVVINFSEPVNVTGTWISVSCGISGTHDTSSGVTTGDGTSTLTFNPTVDFTQGESCTATVFAAQVADADANDPPNLLPANYVFSFSIDAAPSVTAVTPADGATQVATNVNLGVTFSEPVTITNSSVTVSCGTSGAHTVTVSGGPTIWTINPDTDFAAGETCTVTVLAAGVSDNDSNDPPDNLTANYVWSFTTDVPPSVTSTTPANGSTTSPSTNVSITFSEPVDVTGSWFSISCTTTGAHTATVSGGPTTFTLDPNTDFVGGETCTVTIIAAQVNDQDAGDPPSNLTADYVFSFSVDAPPSVTTTTPANGASGLATNTNVTINFSESVNVTGSSFTISCGVSGTHTYTTGAGPSTSFTLDPSVDFAAGETCTVTVVAAQVTDADAFDPPDNMLADYVFSFTMDAAPAVQSTTPANGATSISSGADLAVTFTEPVNATGASFTLSCTTSGAHTFTLSGGPLTWTLNPDTNFTSGETCTVTVLAAGITDVDANDPPDNMLANYVFSFTVDVAPSVTATTPANGDTGLGAGTDLTITFSEPVNLGSTPVTISCTVSGAHTYAVTPLTTGTVFTINPDTNFVEGETCTVTVLAAEVTDDDANDPPDNMLANYVFSYTIDLAPFVSSTDPADNATNGAPAQNITITFSEPVDVAGSWFTISCATTGTHTAVVTGGPTVYTLNPDTDFAGGESCTVTILAAQVTDQDANDPPDSMTADYVFDFIIDEPPTVLSTSPANGATNLATNTAVVITYSEAVNASGTAYSLDCGGAQAFGLTGNGTATHTLTPSSSLPAGTSCTVTITASEITDVDTNDPPDAMAANYSFSFTTDAQPTVTSTTPTNGATGVTTNADVVINFSESVNLTAGAVTISCATSGAHPYAINASPNTSFTINPDVDFAPNELCTVTVVANQVSDADANDPPDNLAANYVFSFTTDAQPSVTATTPANGATSQAIDTNIVITFSETVNATTSSFTLNCGGAQTFTVGGSGTNTITLDPSADLPAGASCTVTVIAAQISDVDTNDPPDGMAADYVFTFTTDQAPSVTTVVPADETTDVARSTNITVNFSENVDVTGASFTIKCPSTGSALPFVFVGASTGVSSVVLDPTADLPDGERCEVTVIGNQVSDSDTNDPPNSMTADYVFQFGVEPNADAETHPHTLVGNISSNTDGFLSVTTNDDYPVSTPVTITAYDATTANGGTIVMQTSGADMGEFTYNPPKGFEGTDSFTYTITNSNGSDTATVSITVSGMVWFVDANAGAAGDGRLSSPFNTLAAFEAVNGNGDVGNNRNPQAGDNIFLYESGSTYSGPVTLETGQRLIGQDSTASLTTVTGLTPAASQPSFPAVNSANGTFVSITSASNGVNVAANNLVRGLRFGNNSGFAIAGSNFGTLTVTDSLVNNGSGGGLSLTTGTLSAAFSSFSTTGGTHGVNLSGVGGGLTTSAGTIANATTAAISVTSGNPTISHSGTINQTNGRPALLTSNVTGGGYTFSTVTVSGSVAAQDAITLDGTGNAVDLSIASATLNTSSMRDGLRLSDLGSGSDVTITAGSITTNGSGRRTINFAGATDCACNFAGVAINGNSSDGLSLAATQLGTYTFGDTDMNTPSGGIGIQVVGDANTANTDSSVTFRSVDINTCSATGILVHSHSGSFAVNGTGAASSGGTISNCTQRGARFGNATSASTGARNITLTDMNFTGNGTSNLDPAGTCGDLINGTNTNCAANIDLQHANTVTLTRVTANSSAQVGINGKNVAGLTLTSVTVDDNGNETNESGIQIHNLTGSMNWTNVNSTNNASRQINVQNSSGTNNLTISGGDFGHSVWPGSTTSAQGILFSGTGTANMTLSVQNADIFRNYGPAFQSDSATGADLNVTVNGGTIVDNGQHFVVASVGAGDMTYALTNVSSMYVDPAHTVVTPISIARGQGASGNYSGVISNNTIGNASIQYSGCPVPGCNVISVRNNGAVGGFHNVTISSNLLQRSHEGGINVTSGVNTTNDASIMRVKILNNTLTAPDDAGSIGLPITVVNGTAAADTTSTCADILNNIIQNTGGTGSWNLSAAIRIRHVQNNTVFTLPGYAGGATNTANVVTYLNARNTLPGGATAAVSLAPGPGSFGGTASCF